MPTTIIVIDNGNRQVNSSRHPGTLDYTLDRITMRYLESMSYLKEKYHSYPDVLPGCENAPNYPDQDDMRMYERMAYHMANGTL